MGVYSRVKKFNTRVAKKLPKRVQRGIVKTNRAVDRGLGSVNRSIQTGRTLGGALSKSGNRTQRTTGKALNAVSTVSGYVVPQNRDQLAADVVLTVAGGGLGKAAGSIGKAVRRSRGARYTDDAAGFMNRSSSKGGPIRGKTSPARRLIPRVTPKRAAIGGLVGAAAIGTYSGFGGTSSSSTGGGGTSRSAPNTPGTTPGAMGGSGGFFTFSDPSGFGSDGPGGPGFPPEAAAAVAFGGLALAALAAQKSKKKKADK